MSVSDSNNMDVVNALKRNRLFRDCDTQSLLFLCENGSFHTIKQGDRIIEEGSGEYDAYVLISGEVRIYRDEFLMARFGQGTLFGEFALMTGTPYSASAEALNEVSVFRISREQFLKTVREHSDFALTVIRNLGLRLRRHL